MKELNIRFESFDISDFCKVCSLIKDKKFDFVKMEMGMPNIPGKALLKKITAAERESVDTVFSNRIVLSSLGRYQYSHCKRLNRFGFHLIIDIDSVKKCDLRSLRGKVRKLKKRKVVFSIRIRDHSLEMKETIYRLKLGNVPYLFENVEYSDACAEYFYEWLFDQNAPFVDVFSGMIDHILIKNDLNDCRHSSCLGKKLYLSKEKAFSLCPVYPEKTALVKLTDVQSLNDIFEREAVLRLIRSSIGKRNDCLDSCKDYEYCKGGCPLLTCEKCKEKDYIGLYKNIQKELQAVIGCDDLTVYNSHVRNSFWKYIVSQSTCK